MRKRKILLLIFFAGLIVLAGIGPGIEAGELKFGLRLSGGMAYFGLGDVNAFIRGHSDYRKENGGVGGYPVSGDLESLHIGLDTGVDLLMFLSPRLAVSLGSGFVTGRAGKGGQGMTIQSPDLTIHDTRQSGIQAVPLTLGIYYFVPLGRSLRLYAAAGGSYYWTKWTNDFNEDWLGLGYEAVHQEANGHGIGFGGGLGFEFHVAPAVALFLEGSGRYAKIGNFEGKMDMTVSEGEDFWHVYSSSGKLYYNEYYWPLTDRWYPTLTVESQKPSESWDRNAREASIDLSGFSIRLGLRLQF